MSNSEEISASKVAGCRMVLAWSTETTRLARERNDAQVVGIGARIHGPAGAAEIVDVEAAGLASPISAG